MWSSIKETAHTTWELIKDSIVGHTQGAWDWLVITWNIISSWISGVWSSIKETAGTTWAAIGESISTATQSTRTWLEGAWSAIAGFLGDTWEGIKRTAGDIWKGIANTVIGFINKIIDAVNGMVRQMNRIKFSVPDWVPVIGGKSWGFDLNTIDNIPMLAKGGIVTGPTLAMVGERGPEAVIPLSAGGGFIDTLADAIERGSYAGTVAGIRVAGAGGGGRSEQQEVVLRIDSTTLARLILPALIKEGQRQGFDLAVRGV